MNTPTLEGFKAFVAAQGNATIDHLSGEISGENCALGMYWKSIGNQIQESTSVDDQWIQAPMFTEMEKILPHSIFRKLVGYEPHSYEKLRQLMVVEENKEANVFDMSTILNNIWEKNEGQFERDGHVFNLIGTIGDNQVWARPIKEEAFNELSVIVEGDEPVVMNAYGLLKFATDNVMDWVR